MAGESLGMELNDQSKTAVDVSKRKNIVASEQPHITKSDRLTLCAKGAREARNQYNHFSIFASLSSVTPWRR
jgi:hypothetical protein